MGRSWSGRCYRNQTKTCPTDRPPRYLAHSLFHPSLSFDLIIRDTTGRCYRNQTKTCPTDRPPRYHGHASFPLSAVYMSSTSPCFCVLACEEGGDDVVLRLLLIQLANFFCGLD